jgi:CRISP-associated protein Cas1
MSIDLAVLDRPTTETDQEPLRFATNEEYLASLAKYEKLANLRLRNFDTAVLGGYGVMLKVRNDGLVVEYQKSHEPGNDTVLRLNRGTHKIKQLVIFTRGGYVTIDALGWLIQQGITLYLMDYNGELLQVLTPKQPRNAKLAYLQYRAANDIPELGLGISTELIRRKTLAQIATLEKFPQLPGQSEAMATLEDGLSLLHKMPTIERLRTLEGRLAGAYFPVFANVPIKWERSAIKAIPEHWHTIGTRNSPISSNGDARHAVNPYQAVLNFSLALLKAQVLEAIVISGLEPTIGFLHSYRGEGKNSLVFDLMEPFRAVVDAMVLAFFQKTTFKKGDFYQEVSGECRMNDELRRFIAASIRVSSIDIDKMIRWLRATLEDRV